MHRSLHFDFLRHVLASAVCEAVFDYFVLATKAKVAERVGDEAWGC